MEIHILGMSNKEKREAFREIYFESGAGLFNCQHLEYGIKVMIYMLSQQNLWPYNYSAAEKIIEDKSKKTLGALIHILKSQGFLDDAIEKTLRDALDARNTLIHNYLVDNAERVAFEPERKQMAREIRAMRRIVQRADEAIGKVIEGMTLYLTIMSIDVDALKKQADAEIHANTDEN